MFSNIDAQGRMVIPSPVRKRLGLKTGDSVIITLTETGFITEPETKTELCILCDTAGSEINPIHEINGRPGKHICKECSRLFKSTQHIKII